MDSRWAVLVVHIKFIYISKIFLFFKKLIKVVGKFQKKRFYCFESSMRRMLNRIISSIQSSSTYIYFAWFRWKTNDSLHNWHWPLNLNPNPKFGENKSVISSGTPLVVRLLPPGYKPQEPRRNLFVLDQINVHAPLTLNGPVQIAAATTGKRKTTKSITTVLNFKNRNEYL